MCLISLVIKPINEPAISPIKIPGKFVAKNINIFVIASTDPVKALTVA